MTTNKTKPEVFLVNQTWFLQTTGLDGAPRIVAIKEIQSVDNRGKKECPEAPTIIAANGVCINTLDSVEDIIAALKGKDEQRMAPHPQESKP